MKSRIKTASGGGQMWRLMLLLAAAVILPTVCLLWFMSQAVKNERLAVRQKLIDSYTDSLAKLKGYNENIWLDWTDIWVNNWHGDVREFFKTMVQTKNYSHGDNEYADALIVYDANGSIVYPIGKTYGPSEYAEGTSDRDKLLWRHEFVERDYTAAARLYESVAGESTIQPIRLRALTGVIRNLWKAGQTSEAIERCEQALADTNEYDVQQFELVMQLRLLRIAMLKNGVAADYETAVGEFVSQATEYHSLFDYSHEKDQFAVAPSESAIFFLQKALELAKDSGVPLEAERIRLAERLIAAETRSVKLASEYLDEAIFEDRGQWFVSRLTDEQDIFGYYFVKDGKKVVVAFDPNNLRLFFQMYSTDDFPQGLDYMITDETGKCVVCLEGPVRPALLAYPVSKYFPDWTVWVFLKDDDLFVSAARRQAALYMWAAALVIALILAVGGFAGRSVGRQMKLNRLKNDFIATVSHELKTPLASMRVLVDTLLEGRYKGEQQATEYLQLVSQENERLSNLIDNFLTFSRMERNKQAFEMSETAPAVIANRAAEAVKTKFEQVQCKFDMSIDDNLPEVLADQDAMVTALVNLLDNACKYSLDDKQIVLRVFAEVDSVCFVVSDKGIGMSRRALKKIFDRFHQVDRRLARRAQGCGLGLSIVEFIVDAHKGTIVVDSKPGKGSVFTIKLPAAD
jgi:signal transduction histidine kinase